MNSKQNAAVLWMVRPTNFGFNQQTLSTNSFQKNLINQDNIHAIALNEFDEMVHQLKTHDIDVVVTQSDNFETPDAVFPNNWISFHHDGTVVIYPMLSKNRRLEKKVKFPFSFERLIDLSSFEEQLMFLEGTGSIVFNHNSRIAYAVISPRTNVEVLTNICDELGYDFIPFIAKDELGKDIYHTNVVMNIGQDYVVICLDAISNPSEQDQLITSFKSSGLKIIAISMLQMNSFAGNMLQVKSKKNEFYTLMSDTAYQSLSKNQTDTIEENSKILSLHIPTIEYYGGGSVRCMIAEIFGNRKIIS
jgi:hypothetical protein